MSRWQLSGDAPTAYDRFALKVMEPWTDDLIRSAGCRDGDRVLDVACGTGLVSGWAEMLTRNAVPVSFWQSVQWQTLIVAESTSAS